MSEAPQYEKALRSLLTAEDGPDFLRWLLGDVCGILRSPMAGTDADVHYLCGKQDVGYILLPMIAELAPNILATLMENTNVQN